MVEVHSIDRCGFAIIPSVIDGGHVARLVEVIDEPQSTLGVRERDERAYAQRNLLTNVPQVRSLATSPEVRGIVVPVLGAAARPVRALLFDKTPGANWKVAWHQDLSIAVRERRDVPAYGPWSMKAGVSHVQPPPEVLERMLTVRLHLDDCGAENGPLKVLPGSHAHGVMAPAEVEAWRQRVAPVACCVPAGGAVVMRPLILHASSSAVSARHRRVIHIEFAAGDLPGGLEWYEPASF